MAGEEWKLKQEQINIEDVAKIACALKSLAVYAQAACEEDDNPAELEQTVNEGLEAIERIFEI